MHDLMVELGIRYLHFLAIFAMFSLLSIEHLLLKGQLDASWIKRIAVVDIAFCISGLVVLGCGLGLWFLGGKPAGFYNGNWAFHTKLTLFVILGIASLIPTRFIRNQRKIAAPKVVIPRYIVHIIRLELLLLCAIPALAVMMANGVGYTY